jgi:hypothetical protein
LFLLFGQDKCTAEWYNYLRISIYMGIIGYIIFFFYITMKNTGLQGKTVNLSKKFLQLWRNPKSMFLKGRGWAAPHSKLITGKIDHCKNVICHSAHQLPICYKEKIASTTSTWINVWYGCPWAWEKTATKSTHD